MYQYQCFHGLKIDVPHCRKPMNIGFRGVNKRKNLRKTKSVQNMWTTKEQILTSYNQANKIIIIKH